MPRLRLPIFLLLAFCALCGAWLLSLDPARRFTTDVTELLPASERDPEARLALSLVRERQSRVVLVVLDVPAATPPDALSAATAAHLRVLRESSAFRHAYSLADRSWQIALGALIHRRRLELLLPGWLASSKQAYAATHSSPASDDLAFATWLADRAIDSLDRRLAAPEGAALIELAASDPLLLLPELAAHAGELADAPPASPDRALIWAETNTGPMTEDAQQPVFDALSAAEKAAHAHVPGLSSRHTGVNRFAAAAKESTRAEISRLNLLALVAVLAISALFVRRVLGLLHLLPAVLISTLGAVTATAAIFPRVHVLVFVIGSLLCGVAVDYVFHLALARREGETYSERVRRLLLPLAGGAGTTFVGFLALTTSDLPLVRQLGVYVAAGVVCGLGAALLYFSAFPGLDWKPRTWRTRLDCPRRLRAPILLALTIFSAAGLARVGWNDDLRNLQYPAPGLRAVDASVRADFGEKNDYVSLVTRGDSFAEARERWDVLSRSVPAQSKLSGLAGLFPLPSDYHEANTPATRTLLADFARALPEAAERAGYEPGVFQPFLSDLAAHLARPPGDYEVIASETLAALPGPLALLAHSGADGAWLLSRASTPPSLDNHEGTLRLSGIEGLNHLFARYRVDTARLGVIGIAILVLISCAMHGLRDGCRTAALPLLAAAIAFALLAWRGEAFGIFHLLGALLGVCLADDYAHFAHADAGDPLSRVSIRLSALTTAASFAVLTLSSIPAISSLGASVALIVILALIFVETDLFSLHGHA